MTTALTWETSPAAWGAFAAVAIAGIAAAWHYARAGRFGLACGLRAAALFLLALTTLRPTLKYEMATNVARPVRIVVDDSISMAVADVRSSSEWLRVAETLGLFKPPAVRPLREAERTRAAINAMRQVEQKIDAARQANAGATAERVQLYLYRQAALVAVRALADIADESATGAVAAVEQALRGDADAATVLRRLDAAWPTLRRTSDAADDELVTTDEDTAAAVDRLDGTSRYGLAVNAVKRLASLGVTRAVTLDGSTYDPAKATVTLPSTPLMAALRDACGRAAATGEEAVVLLSDGRSTETRSLLPQVAATGVPVYTVAVAPEDRSPDVRVTRVETPSAVLAGQNVPVRVRLTQRNVDRPVRVTVTDGRRTIAADAPTGGDVVVTLNWTAASAPRLDLLARAEALPGERQLTNNTLTTSTAVLDHRVRVRLVSGAPSSRDAEEFAGAASAASWVDFKRDGPPDFDADVIVLADVTPETMNDAAWDQLRRAVRERGASLLVLAGRGDWLRDAATAARLAPLLPTTSGPQPAWVTPPQPVWPVPTRAGVDMAYLRTDESSEASVRAWLGRPRLSRVLSVGPPAGWARTLLLDRVTNLPVLVDSAVGGGRCVAVLVDEVWRWSAAADAADASRLFWVGLLQSLADLPYAKRGDGLELSVDCLLPVAGRTFFVRARAVDPTAGAVSVVVSKNGVVVSTLPLRETLSGGGRFVAPANVPADTYDVIVRQGGRSLAEVVSVAGDEPTERLDTSPDLAQLRRIADATGGEMINLEDLGRLPDLLALRRDREPRIGTYALWSSPWWFLTIVACLGLEWAVRPRAGLA